MAFSLGVLVDVLSHEYPGINQKPCQPKMAVLALFGVNCVGSEARVSFGVILMQQNGVTKRPTRF
jgi:hypothetical protein